MAPARHIENVGPDLRVACGSAAHATGSGTSPRSWSALAGSPAPGSATTITVPTSASSAPATAGAPGAPITRPSPDLPADPLLATSLYEDPSAGLHEDASAILREHPALLGCSILRRTSPPSSAGGHQHPAGGHEKGAVAITESDRILGHCTGGQLPNPYSG